MRQEVPGIGVWLGGYEIINSLATDTVSFVVVNDVDLWLPPYDVILEKVMAVLSEIPKSHTV